MSNRDGGWPPPYFPPLGSLRSRDWNLKTEFAGRTVLPTPGNRSLHGESWSEGKAALCLMADPRVRLVQEQPALVKYVDLAGKERDHTVDLLAHMHDGSRTAVLVKPRAIAIEEDLLGMMRLLAAQVPVSFADRWMHMHEGHMTRDVVDNAGLIVGVLTDGPRSDDALVGRIAAMVDIPTRIRDVVRSLGADAFRAVVRLIADGALRVSDGLLIHIDAMVAPVALVGATR